jgi:hypothetical protein
MAGGIAQVVEKQKALNSTLSTTKKQNLYYPILTCKHCLRIL